MIVTSSSGQRIFIGRLGNPAPAPISRSRIL
jgi:hypothetical protein